MQQEETLRALNQALANVKFPQLDYWHPSAINARINAHITDWWLHRLK